MNMRFLQSASPRYRVTALVCAGCLSACTQASTEPELPAAAPAVLILVPDSLRVRSGETASLRLRIASAPSDSVLWTLSGPPGDSSFTAWVVSVRSSSGTEVYRNAESITWPFVEFRPDARFTPLRTGARGAASFVASSSDGRPLPVGGYSVFVDIYVSAATAPDFSQPRRVFTRQRLNVSVAVY
jgi:hypothetical protein